MYYFTILNTGTALAFTTTIMVLDIFLPEVSDFKPNIGHSTCFIEVVYCKLLLTDGAVFSAGQRIQTDDLFLHSRHALCPPQPRPLPGHRGEAQHAQQADQDCEAVTEVRIISTNYQLPSTNNQLPTK